MLHRLITPKEEVICVPETYSCQEAIEFLEENNLRNAPVVDATGTLFRGNIYRYHIYKYKFHHPEVDLSAFSVTYLLKNATKTIQETDSVIHLLFSVRDLPYITVLNDQQSFVGIIEHEKVLDFFQQAWTMGDLTCMISVKSYGPRGDLRKVARAINRYCDISMATTLEATSYNTTAAIIFGLPKSVDPLRVRRLVQYLQRHKYQFEVYHL